VSCENAITCCIFLTHWLESLSQHRIYVRQTYNSQFRKTAVAVAIAGIAAVTPQIASADTVLSGVVAVNINGDDADNDGTIGADDGVAGITATHTMDNGLDAYGSLRFDGDTLSGGGVTNDNFYVGMKGGFGDLRFGEVPVAAEYGQVAGDLFDQTGGINGGISYTGAFGPATVGVSYSPARNEDTIGAGAKFNIGGFAIGVGAEQRVEKDEGVDNVDTMNFSVGASFALAGASVAVHYVDAEGDADDNGEVDDDNRNVIGVKLGYAIAGVSLGLTHHIQDIGDNNETITRLDLGYGLGGGMKASGRYQIDDGDTDGADSWKLVLTKSF